MILDDTSDSPALDDVLTRTVDGEVQISLDGGATWDPLNDAEPEPGDPMPLDDESREPEEEPGA